LRGWASHRFVGKCADRLRLGRQPTRLMPKPRTTFTTRPGCTPWLYVTRCASVGRLIAVKS
jgi:hypothetical protein